MNLKKEFTKLQKWKIEFLIEECIKNDNGNFEIELSDEIAYSDNEGIEYTGLKKDYEFEINSKKIYVFDNHNKAIFYIFKEYQKSGEVYDILHIDAHRDDAKFCFDYPEEINQKNIQEIYQQSRISDYLDLLEKTSLIGKIFNITQSYEFQNLEIPKSHFVLNLDIDIFGPEGEVVDLELKIKRIVQIWKKAEFVMIATSPGFINQKNAKFLIEAFLKRV